MSSYCIPNKQTKLGPGPKMFMKVWELSYRRNRLLVFFIWTQL
jgi:hypothetical protein